MNQKTSTIKTVNPRRYATDSDVHDLNKIILHIKTAKETALSARYNESLRDASIILTKLWRVENL